VRGGEHVVQVADTGDDVGDAELSGASLPARVECLAVEEIHQG
jgi:hypothetical protein